MKLSTQPPVYQPARPNCPCGIVQIASELPAFGVRNSAGTPGRAFRKGTPAARPVRKATGLGAPLPRCSESAGLSKKLTGQLAGDLSEGGGTMWSTRGTVSWRLAFATAAAIALAACSGDGPTTTAASAPQTAVGTAFNNADACMADDVAEFGK